MQQTFKRARVWVLNVNPGQVADDYSDSWAALRAADIANGWGCVAGKYGARSGSNVSRARNDLAVQFLDTTDGEWALFLDSDMVFPEDTVVRLLAAAEQADTKIIGGLCVAATEHGPMPTLFQHAEAGAPTITVQHTDYPENTILEVAATGTACLMVHRCVLEAIREASPDDKRYCWFQEAVRRSWVSEDVEFCLRARELGFSVYVDTTLTIGHYKFGRVWRPEDIKTGVGFPRRPLVAVIPTAGKDDMVVDLVGQLASQGECAEIIVVNNGAVPSDLPVTVLAADPEAGIHAWWNLGADYALERHGHRVHIAFLNDDLCLGPGFMGAMSRALDSHPNLVAVSGNYDGRRATDAGLGRNEPVQEVRDICAGRYDGTGGLAGFAFMTTGNLFTSGYRFPEECKWWYGDNDMVGVVLAGGGKIGIAIRAEVEHLDGGSRTGDWASPEMAEQLAADRKAFEARWAVVDWNPTVLAGAS